MKCYSSWNRGAPLNSSVRPMIAFYSFLADRWYHMRWWFGGIAVTSIIAMIVLLFQYRDSPATLAIVLAILPSLIAIFWALELLCVSFHPEKGRLKVDSRATGTASLYASFKRGVSATFITIMLLVGIFVFPLHAMFGK
jgi:Na+/melibiose symporter-like transporter